jgi:hypothetical protein
LATRIRNLPKEPLKILPRFVFLSPRPILKNFRSANIVI